MEYILFLTYRCNLSCSYCFAKNLVHDDKKNSLSITSENIEHVCKYIENDIRVNERTDNSIVFFGGEPCLVPDIILDFMKRTSHMQLNYSI
jgi:sulfatase maturation enzyme AslB (radical SAM superfamily)